MMLLIIFATTAVIGIGVCLLIYYVIGYIEEYKHKARCTVDYNRLRVCNVCNRYYRRYQAKLRAIQERNENYLDCAHCGSGYTREEYSGNTLFDTHRDCPKLSDYQRYKMYKRFVKISDINKSIKEIEELQAYERRRKVGGEL